MVEASSSIAPVTSAIILAGGLGTRLREAVPDVPKPMAVINGRPFLEHQLDYWIDQGIRSFVLSVGYRHEKIIGHFGHQYRGAEIDYAIESVPLGTGGGLLLAAHRLTFAGPWLVVNGDTFFEVPLADMVTFHLTQRADWTFALFRTFDTRRYMGMQVARDGAITALCNPALASDGALANGGVYLVNPSVLERCQVKAGQAASLEGDLLTNLIDQGARFFGTEYAGRFIDIGIPADYYRASSLLI